MTTQPPGRPLARQLLPRRVDHHKSQRHAERGTLELLAHPHQWYPAGTAPLDFSACSASTQPNGNKLPLSSAKISLRFGNATMNAEGTPSTSAI